MPYLANQTNSGPVIVKGDIITPILIAIITIIIFLVFWVWVANTIAKDATSPQGSNTTGGKLLLSCNPGECGTNMLSGEKRCPNLDTDVILIDPASEVCNPKFTCTNPLTPFALLSNGSTNDFGVCEPGITCRCLKNSQCATHVASLFVTVNGSLFDPSSNNRFTFSQVPLRSDLGAKNIQYSSTSSNFCAIKTSRLNRLSPGSCTFTSADYQNPDFTLKLATDCINSNPCIVGTMAFDPTNPDLLQANGISVDDVRNIPVTCIRAFPSADTSGTAFPDNKCGPQTAPYWSGKWGLILCAKINLKIYPT